MYFKTVTKIILSDPSSTFAPVDDCPRFFVAGGGGGARGQEGLPHVEYHARQRRKGAAAEAGGHPRLVRGH